MSISATTQTNSSSSSAASKIFKDMTGQATEAEEGAFESTLTEAEETSPQAEAMMALAMAGNPSIEKSKALKTMEAAANPAGTAADAAMKKSREMSPREKLINAVQLQERQSASTNTVDAMTGLQPWDKHWVFKRGDTALVSPEAALAESEQKEGLGKLLEQIQSLQAQRRGSVDVTAANGQPQQANPRAAADDRLSQKATSGPQARQSNARINPQEGAQATEWSDLQQMLAQVQQSPEEAALDSAGEVRKRKQANSLQQKPKAALQGMSSSDYLGIRDAMNAKQDPLAAGPRMPKPGTPMEGPVGTWKPKKEPGQDGLFPQQESALRATLAQSQMSAANSLNAALNQGAGKFEIAKPKEMQGWVTQGSMAQNRLSTETMLGIGTELRSMTQMGGGEMRIRLRPDHLGELSVRVNTSGNQVALEIQASDEKAKRIIEDSVSYLKDSLASQNLTVSRLDLTVAPASAQGNSNFDLSQQQANPQQQQGLGAELSQNEFGRHQQSSNNEGPDRQEVGLSRSQGNASQTARFSQSGRTASNSRLDVMA
jgi:hypothetical protein